MLSQAAARRGALFYIRLRRVQWITATEKISGTSAKTANSNASLPLARQTGIEIERG
ncbi:MAG TPA: hypothetical protein VFY10_07210 [Dehalococcoidia bacterium]|nr:hypothetical protein [Dehalococcoidia bacterium]